MEDMFWFLLNVLVVFGISFLVGIAILRINDWYKNYKRFKNWEERLKEDLCNIDDRRKM